jgi:hypothetical protein
MNIWRELLEEIKRGYISGEIELFAVGVTLFVLGVILAALIHVFGLLLF